MSPATLTTRQKVLATIGVMLALLLAALDQTIVGTAMPRIVAELQGLDFYAWVTTAYLVTSTVLVPIAGKLGDMFGRKPFVLTGMIGFMVASWLCGLSQNMPELVLLRGLQGVFGGVLFASVFTVLADIFTLRERTRMQGIFGAVFGLASVIGPFIGGAITDNWGWRWVFYVNIPVGVIGILVVVATLPYVRSKASWREIDFLGCLALAAGAIPLLIALSITNNHAWTSAPVVGLLALATVMLVAFFLIERRARQPVVPFQLFRHNVFAVSVVIAFFSAFGMFGAIVFVPLVYQGVLGISATNSGTLLTPMMLGLVAFSMVGGQLMPRLRRYRFLGTAGISAMIVGMLLLGQISPGASQWRAALDIILVGAGLGLTFPLTITVVQAALPRSVVGVATSQVQFWRNLGGTVGTAVLGSVLSRTLTHTIPERVSALHLTPQIAGAASGLGGGSPQGLFDPTTLARARAQLPPAGVQAFNQLVEALRWGLSDALHDVFLIGAAIMVVAWIASLFMREVSLTSTRQTTQEEVASESMVG